ncbi:MAG: hypothetical protein HAW59_00480 [Betaproteobacteria bacterium]|nr:hypothetical protein [Betaproteobacteria bacterium]
MERQRERRRQRQRRRQKLNIAQKFRILDSRLRGNDGVEGGEFGGKLTSDMSFLRRQESRPAALAAFLPPPFMVSLKRKDWIPAFAGMTCDFSRAEIYFGTHTPAIYCGMRPADNFPGFRRWAINCPHMRAEINSGTR